MTQSLDEVIDTIKAAANLLDRYEGPGVSKDRSVVVELQQVAVSWGIKKVNLNIVPCLRGDGVTDQSPFGLAQREVFSSIVVPAESTVVFPAIGLDQGFLHHQEVVTVGPYESDYPKHVNALAEDWVKEQSEADTVLILKGLQGIYTSSELEGFVQDLSPQEIWLCGSAKEFSEEAKGYPLFDEQMVRFISSFGFSDISATAIPSHSRKALKTLDGLLPRFSLSRSGWFPLTKLAVFKRDLSGRAY